MAAFDQNNDDDVISSINIIPFVDIVLVLLIIFMVTSTTIIKAALKVELPTAASAGSEVESTVNLVFTKDGRLFLDGEEVDRDEMRLNLESGARANPNIQAVISADRVLPYGDVVGLIDLVKQSGITTFALNIERELGNKS